MKIAQKIGETQIERNSPFRIFDVVSVTLVTNNCNKILEIMNDLNTNSQMRMVRIRNNLKEPQKSVVINVVYGDSIIGCVSIIYEGGPVNDAGNHFLNELIKADSAGQFKQHLLTYVCDLVASQLVIRRN